MKISLKKFGTTLTSRDQGKEAYSAYLPVLRELKQNESIEVDFEGVKVFTPSWADEFLTKLKEDYPSQISYINTANPSVKATLELLEQIGEN